MSNRIDTKFGELRKRGKKALIAYLTVGFPDLETNYRLILKMEKRGVSMVELGIPFSDPIADGPTIQASSQAALKKGVSLRDALELARRVRRTSSIPLIVMGYLNPFLALKAEDLAARLARVGIDGVIIPDLPPEDASSPREALRKEGLHLIFLLAPTSSPERVALVAEKSSGFIYYVSRTGVTGARRDLAAELNRKVKEIKRVAALPVCVGFGISTREQLRRVWRVADGAIVGSALIRPFLNAESPDAAWKKTIQALSALLPRNLTLKGTLPKSM